ncbi:hypothetical protein FIBSPDRAFT_947000 [Athelia psychrophila]|uniref:Uncharacterized protein n=1 Tax=Athelia psychrophila TaxID=1759441 RepID=A0A166SF10_9AGAM|nr:hypothetical protein FIBSPDRAFT_947000 [Fibularhizoctonia sp. CBS 109695]
MNSYVNDVLADVVLCGLSSAVSLVIARYDGSRTTAPRSLLLYNYVKKHLTTDYIGFTEDVVTALLSEGLAQVPITDPYPLTLPEEPLDALIHILKLTKLKPYDEKFSILHEDALGLLRQVLGVSEKPITERIWNEKDPELSSELCSVILGPPSLASALFARHPS